jgi:hypothetical protein
MIASVKVVKAYPQPRYIDYLSLVKFDDAWRIVNKGSHGGAKVVHLHNEENDT